MMFSKHALVHLHDGVTWTTMDKLGESHSTDLDKCVIHLCYLGQGIFVELVKRDIPLKILEDNKAVQSLVIGKLSADESTSINQIVFSGLGVGLDPTQPRASSSAISKKDLTQPGYYKSRHSS